MGPNEASHGVDSIRQSPAAAEKRLHDLSFRPNCTRQEITRAYHQLAQELHPDHGGDAAAFQRLQHEYEAALSRLTCVRRPPQNSFLLRPASSVPVVRSSRVLWLILLAIPLAGITYFLDAWPRWMFFSFVVSFLILAGLPLLLSGCRPAIAAVLTLIVIFVAGTLLAGILMSGMLREALHPIGKAPPGETVHPVTITLTLLSIVALVASILGFLFSLSDHGLE